MRYLRRVCGEIVMQTYFLNQIPDLLQTLSKTEHNIYLLLDGAKFTNIHAFIYKTDEFPQYSSLYKDTYYESILEISPCLVQMKSLHDKFLSWYISKGSDAHQAIVITSGKDLAELADHFKNFLEAKLPNLNIVLFRFYEPNVLNTILKFHDQHQVKKFISLCSAMYWKYCSYYCGITNKL